MNLYLVQHAEAKSKQEDAGRSLTDKGYADIDKTAKLLSSKLRPSINVILHSGKLRARQTAEVLADYLNPAGGIRAVDGLDPKADPAVWATQLKSITENVVLVGHLPHISRLASLLLCGETERTVVEFRNAGIVNIVRDDQGDWKVQCIILPGICD
ncbi:MAG: phosphohistidine phosphatase SixA [Candidatus Zixiibacteriota bacterium]|nr:MAG: phosphohistidine phosphatase SixA [candidate division Zixibacteria bacterium]